MAGEEAAMRKRMAVIVAALVATMTLSLSASAHNAGPCNDAGGPGNSDYAKHHIVALATTGGMGVDGHVPGDHRGFSACLGVHP
jgi:hypothetical protein